MKLATVQSPTVGVDGTVNSASSVASLITELRAEGGITVRTNFDPLALIWTDRPPVPQDKVSIHPLEYAGEPCHDKMARIRQQLKSMHAYGMLVSALDDIAWTLNLRGTDVHCNPVFVSYLLIDTKRATLFVDRAKLTPEVEAYLEAEGVAVAGYADVRRGLERYGEYNILMDDNETCYTLFNIPQCQKVVAPSPIPAMKAVKNPTEIEGFRRAMLRDGVALVKFMRWLRPAVEAGGQTEMSVDAKLTALRAAQELYRGLSFDTIAAYREHGAIVHYEATPETDAELRPEGLILIDSGAQYLDGTTDITRTVALGPVTDEERLVYTLVLKGHIQLELCKFPRGASGTQLDALARKDMWAYGYNYLHGTGHGVGSYLNVHEGPHQIRMEYKPGHDRNRRAGHLSSRTLRRTHGEHPARSALPRDRVRPFSPVRAAHALPHRHRARNYRHAYRRREGMAQRLSPHRLRPHRAAARRRSRPPVARQCVRRDRVTAFNSRCFIFPYKHGRFPKDRVLSCKRLPFTL